MFNAKKIYCIVLYFNPLKISDKSSFRHNVKNHNHQHFQILGQTQQFVNNFTGIIIRSHFVCILIITHYHLERKVVRKALSGVTDTTLIAVLYKVIPCKGKWLKV